MKTLLKPDGLGWIVVGALVAGVTTYALLAFVAAGLGPAPFDKFSLYWALLIVVSVGGYLPIEQIVARRTASGSRFDQLRRWSTRWGGATAGVAGVVLVAVVAATSQHDGLSIPLVLILAANLLGVALQAAIKGAAAGRRRFDVYAGITCTDAVLRTAVCAALASQHTGAIETYAGAIAAGCWISVLVGLLLLRDGDDVADAGLAPSSSALTSEALGLVPAMISMQLLLNSTIVIAFFSGDVGANAGRVLAISSLVRTAVFIAQAAQAGYVARIAALVHSGDPQTAKVVATVMALSGGLAAATVLGSWAFGPVLVDMLYGKEFSVSRTLCLLASLGIGTFVTAIVANDLAVARGVHQHAFHHWGMGVVAAACTGLVVPEGDLRTFLPLFVGSLVALLLTVRSTTSSSSRGTHRR